AVVGAGGRADAVGDRIAVGDDRAERVGRIDLDPGEEGTELRGRNRFERLADEVARWRDGELVDPGQVAGARPGIGRQVELDLEPREVGQVDLDRVAQERRAARNHRGR